jgi:hypothetical protein
VGRLSIGGAEGHDKSLEDLCCCCSSPSRPQPTGWSDKKFGSHPDLKELTDLIHNTVFKPHNIMEDVKSAMGPYCAQVQKYCLLLFFQTAQLRCVWSSWLDISWCCPDTIFCLILHTSYIMSTSLNPVPNAQVCVYLTVHITKLQLQTTFPKPLYHISHVFIGTLVAENLDVCIACDPWDSNI